MSEVVMKPAAQCEGEEALDMMRHAVGLDYGKRKAGFRNNYAASVGSDAERGWWVLVGLGLAEAGGDINEGSMRYFHVSAKGLKFLGVRLKK